MNRTRHRFCRRPADLPGVDGLAALLEREPSVAFVLFPSPASRAAADRLVETATERLPLCRAHVMVQARAYPFDSETWRKRGAWQRRAVPLLRRALGLPPRQGDPAVRLYAVRLPSPAQILADAPAVVDAARQFGDLARTLCGRLAPVLGVPLQAFADPLVRARAGVPGAPQPRGALGDGWHYWFHGFEVCFTHERTGQTLDVRLGFADEFGALDAWFFQQFLESTPGGAAVPACLGAGGSAVYSHVLQTLHAHGHLVEIEGAPTLSPPLRGLVPARR